MQRVETLQQAGVSPIIIFDGGRLPMKSAEEGTRARCASCSVLTNGGGYEPQKGV